MQKNSTQTKTPKLTGCEHAGDLEFFLAIQSFNKCITKEQREEEFIPISSHGLTMTIHVQHAQAEKSHVVADPFTKLFPIRYFLTPMETMTTTTVEHISKEKLEWGWTTSYETYLDVWVDEVEMKCFHINDTDDDTYQTKQQK